MKTMQTMTLNDRVRIPEEVVFHKVEEEMVLLNLETGFYYGLDLVGSRMWKLLAEKGSLRAVFETMAEEYEVAPEELQRDILHLVQELQAKRLIEVVQG